MDINRARGKSVDTGEWIYGYYEKYNGDSYINRQTDILNSGGYPIREFIKVIPETVGLCSELTDRKGTFIYEGDIMRTCRAILIEKQLKGYYGYDRDGYPQRVPGYEGSMTVTELERDENFLAVVTRTQSGSFYLEGASVVVDAITNEVVGNVYDNPDLICKGDKDV